MPVTFRNQICITGFNIHNFFTEGLSGLVYQD
jgi:hypothetical protein